MSEVLVPYTAFGPQHLAIRLGELVNNKAVATDLVARNLHGPIARYSDVETAFDAVQRGRRSEGSVQHFAVVDGAGDVQGLHLFTMGFHSMS